MKLYKDFKQEEERKRQEETDKKLMGENKEIIIVYEKSHVEQILKVAVMLLLFALAIVAMICLLMIF